MIEAPAPVLTTGERSTSPSRLLIAQHPSVWAAENVRLAIAIARDPRILPPEIRAALVQETCARCGNARESANAPHRRAVAPAIAHALRPATARQLGATPFPESVGWVRAYVRSLHAHLHARRARAALRARRTPDLLAALQHRAGPGRARRARARGGRARGCAAALGSRAGAVAPRFCDLGQSADQRARGDRRDAARASRRVPQPALHRARERVLRVGEPRRLPTAVLDRSARRWTLGHRGALGALDRPRRRSTRELRAAHHRRECADRRSPRPHARDPRDAGRLRGLARPGAGRRRARRAARAARVRRPRAAPGRHARKPRRERRPRAARCGAGAAAPAVAVLTNAFSVWRASARRRATSPRDRTARSCRPPTRTPPRSSRPSRSRTWCAR